MLKECTVRMQARLNMGAADAKSIYARTITNFGMIAAGPKAKICHLHVIAGAMGNKLVVKFVRKRTNHKMDLKKRKHKTQKQCTFVFFKYYKFVYKNERGTQTLSTDVYKVHTYCVFLRTHMYSMYVICEYMLHFNTIKII